MKKFSAALLIASFVFGMCFADVEAKGIHHKKHQHMRHHASHNHKRHHRKHQVALRPVVEAHIHIASQYMSVDVNGARYAEWAVSTARSGYSTPQGSFHATRLARVYFSKKYDNSPMPNSVFFHGGNAIHGTYHIRALGHPASHGCVRLLPEHAAELYAMVEHYGMARTRIIVTE